ncbi:hypothetical protein SLEP1_g41510 [Rubroshorea leprosula]|uniref:Reverse transcriptase Ty1/copia-type domain-containing protein n=1 Tax=Rubroshorea leprosula TaxID=152421 RepID=A0AAV5L6Q6_9ROSI|nr:hypothetical protein SLEP1_g41510 [Rubroshorea leprosula]
MFSSLSNFQVSSSDQPPLFTNSSIELFPNDSDADTFDELHDASPHAPRSFIEDALSVGKALDNGESSSLPSSISHIGSDLVEPENEILYPPSSRPTREYGIDYEETFAPVAHPTSVRSLIAIVAAKRWKLFQMDVKNAFLNGDLAEEVYMQPPLGLEHPPNKVYQLNPHDIVLFIHKTHHGMVLRLLYVDDMIIIGDDISSIHDLKQFLSHKFEMKDLGVLSHFLGLEVTSSDDGYLISQTKYAYDLISKVRLTDSKTASTPFESNVRLTSIDGSPLVDPTCYRQLVGSLIYLTTTQPDIAYAVHVVNQFIATPCSTHYAAILRIIHYIKGTIFHGLHFSAHSSLELHGYSDAD